MTAASFHPRLTASSIAVLYPAPCRREEMCSVASEEDPTAAEALGNQRVTRRPRVPREDLRVDLGAHRSSKHGEGIRLGDLRFILAVAQLGVKRKLPLARPLPP
jgi:hypothetical protein